MPGASLRLLVVVVGLWAGGRWLMLQDRDEPPPDAPPAYAPTYYPTPVRDRLSHSRRALARSGERKHQEVRAQPRPSSWAKVPSSRTSPAETPSAPHPPSAPLPDLAPAAYVETMRDDRPTLPGAAATNGRWSGSAWLLLRNGAPAALIATNGQLGGSQAGGRLRWQANRSGPLSKALTARISGPLASVRETELALGGEWHPIAGQPIWLSVERRIALGRRGRNAWSAQVVGGFWQPDLPLGLVAEGYGQAGLIGTRSRDAFIDGQLRVARPLADSDAPRIGAGLWGAAQPGVARLDLGPVLTVPLKISGQRVAASIEGRIRIAGDAMPASGVAFTLGAEF